MAAKFITEHLAAHDLAPDAGRAATGCTRRTRSMNELVARARARPRRRRATEAPIILDEYGNTASAGSLIAFSHHNEDLAGGHATAMMASFGAGYSLGSLLLQRR